jgi:hypothetical protein
MIRFTFNFIIWVGLFSILGLSNTFAQSKGQRGICELEYQRWRLRRTMGSIIPGLVLLIGKE